MTSISPVRSGLPSRSQRHARTRAVSVVLGAGGLTMALAPSWVVETFSPGRSAPASWIVRVLGARSVVQHALIVARPTRQAVQFGAVLDGLYAASMAPAGLLWSGRFRWAAGVSAGYAVLSAVAQLAVAPQSEDAVRVPGDV